MATQSTDHILSDDPNVLTAPMDVDVPITTAVETTEFRDLNDAELDYLDLPLPDDVNTLLSEDEGEAITSNENSAEGDRSDTLLPGDFTKRFMQTTWSDTHILAWLVLNDPTSGCMFTDSAWTLRMRNVRGYNLFKQINLERPKSTAPPTNNERLDHVNIQKAVLCMLITPGYYGRMVKEKRLAIRLNMALEYWPTDGSRQINVTQIDVYRRLAALGSSEEVVNDVFLFAYDFVSDDS
ncbi:hypothetical protein B0H16DRAFT_1740457 [Mycena metata]|uniref:Uncharacterized protein n=1 Tax=Mycena metata TaxID=1033252 RepID=A0AAD7HDB8_9AGAR|nr:hypothetical protein B0H16DRAFT_1740457 [Mycena metata]